MSLLAGIRVLDFSRVMSGPYCTALLADLGAEVIKVETPEGGDEARRFGPFADGASVYFAALNRNKKSITLNLKSPQARALAAQLAAKSDVVVENFRPGVAARLEIDAARLRKADPRLVYLSISGFGQAGALSGWPAYDLVIQAMSGFMSTTGSPAGPPTAAGESIADVVTGMFGSWAVLAALMHRERTGEGQTIDLSMMDSMLALQLTGLSRYQAEGAAPRRVGNRHPITTPVDAFAAADGHVAMVVPSDGQFRELCALMGEPALAQDERYGSNASRRANESSLRALIERWTGTQAVDDIVRACHSRGIPAGPVWDLAQAWRSREGPPNPCQPARFSSEKSGAASAPALGEHTSGVLGELLGLKATKIDALRAQGAL
jgi:CoA:oxalate CoA-transferase